MDKKKSSGGEFATVSLADVREHLRKGSATITTEQSMDLEWTTIVRQGSKFQVVFVGGLEEDKVIMTGCQVDAMLAEICEESIEDIRLY